LVAITWPYSGPWLVAILYHVEDLHLLLLAGFYRRFQSVPFLFGEGDVFRGIQKFPESTRTAYLNGTIDYGNAETILHKAWQKKHRHSIQ